MIGSETVDVEPKLDKVGNLHPGDPGPHKMVKDSIVAVKCVHYLHPGPLGPGIPDIVVPALAPYRAVLHVRPSVRQRIPALKTSPPSFILLLHGFPRRDMAALTAKVAPQRAGTKENKGNNDKIFVFLKIRNVSFWSRLFLNVPLPARDPSRRRAFRSGCLPRSALHPAHCAPLVGPFRSSRRRKKTCSTERNLPTPKETCSQRKKHK